MTLEDETRDYFRREVVEHEMTIVLDQGLHRHLRFRRPGTGIWAFDIITWPGRLMITGDIADFAFARLPDMFEFFGGDPDRINAHYWGEKLIAPRDCRSYSEARFRAVVGGLYREAVEDGAIAPDDAEPVWHDLELEVLEYAYARELAMPAAEAFESHSFEFHDVWDWDVRDFDWHYLLCCWAIVWGIAKYREHKAAAPTVKVWPVPLIRDPNFKLTPDGWVPR